MNLRIFPQLVVNSPRRLECTYTSFTAGEESDAGESGDEWLCNKKENNDRRNRKGKGGGPVGRCTPVHSHRYTHCNSIQSAGVRQMSIVISRWYCFCWCCCCWCCFWFFFWCYSCCWCWCCFCCCRRRWLWGCWCWCSTSP